MIEFEDLVYRKSDLMFDLMTMNLALKPEVSTIKIKNLLTFKSVEDTKRSRKKLLPISLPNIA